MLLKILLLRLVIHSSSARQLKKKGVSTISTNFYTGVFSRTVYSSVSNSVIFVFSKKKTKYSPIFNLCIWCAV